MHVLEKYAGEKLHFYQLLANDGVFDVRILSEGAALRELKWNSQPRKISVGGKDKRKKGFAGYISTVVGVQSCWHL